MIDNDNSKNILFSVRGLRKVFPNNFKVSGSFEALSEIDLDIFERECLLIAGANGSGKTLLMKILTGLVNPTDGEILFRGIAVKKCIKLIRCSVGLVYQDAQALGIGA